VNPRTRRLIVTGVLVVLVMVALIGAIWGGGQS
jgi:preprotein translocase subunit SecE